MVRVGVKVRVRVRVSLEGVRRKARLHDAPERGEYELAHRLRLLGAVGRGEGHALEADAEGGLVRVRLRVRVKG